MASSCCQWTGGLKRSRHVENLPNVSSFVTLMLVSLIKSGLWNFVMHVMVTTDIFSV